jgi:uncharacterized membrane protein
MKNLRNVFDEKTNLNTTERVVSGLVGLTLLIMGIRALKDTSPRKRILFASSALLFFRGITGFSPVRSLFENSTGKNRNPIHESESSVENLRTE